MNNTDREKFFEILRKHNCYIPIDHKEAKGKFVLDAVSKAQMNYIIFDDGTCLINASSQEWYDDDSYVFYVDPMTIHNEYDDKYFSDWKEFRSAGQEWYDYKRTKENEEKLERDRKLYEELKKKFES